MRINVTAPCNQLGYGQVSTHLIHALDELGHEPALFPLAESEIPEGPIADAVRSAHERASRYCRRAPSLRVWHEFDLSHHVGKGLHCAFTIFELDRFKRLALHHLLSQDVIFTPSQWGKETLVRAGVHGDKVVVAPLGVNREVFRPVEQGVGSPSEATIFINVGKWEVRKGHVELLTAFCSAFNEKDNVRLVMACENPCFKSREEMEKYNNEWRSFYMTSRMASKITLVPRLRSQSDVAALMAQADCGVFPSRAEGWGLESAEMLSMGKQVILTNFAGHTEYANQQNSLLVSIDKTEPAHDGRWFNALDPGWGGSPGEWARLGDDQIDQLVAHMRDIHERKRQGLPVNQAGIETMAPFTWKNTAEIVARELA